MSEQDHKSTVDKIIMGAIIGTAIGSALGLTLAPKKGTETREIAKEKTKGLFQLGKEIIKLILKKNGKAKKE